MLIEQFNTYVNVELIMIAQKVKKVLFWVSFILLIFWLISPFVRIFLKIEWSSPESLESYQSLVRIGFPLSLFTVFISSIKQNEKSSTSTARILAAIILPFISLPFFAFSGMCSYEKRTLFYNLESESIIIERSLGCGAWDSDPPNYKTVEVIPFLGFFNYVRTTDTLEIDKSQWKRYIE
jgi:hypothetical protein